MIAVCNGRNMTDNELKLLPFTRPEFVSDRWQGVPHYDLVHTLETRMDAAGWRFSGRKVSIDDTGFDMVGAWDVKVPGIDEFSDQKLSIGFQHSNRCRRALRLLVGTTVLVCTNGMATGEVVLRRKHTTGLRLEVEIDEALYRYVDAAKLIKARTDAMKETELRPEQADHLLMEAGRKGLIGWSTLGAVSQEYLHPTFADNGSPTVWGLYNAFTHIIKKVSVNRQLDLMWKFQQMMPVKNAELVA